MTWKNRYSGLDTETIGGYAVILSTEYRAWSAQSFEECVEPIFNDYSHGNISGRMVLFNLNYDARAILKYLPTDKLKEFRTNTDKNGDVSNTIYYGKYRILYIPNKLVRISKGHHVISLFDIAQFYNSSLDNAAKTHLGNQKLHNAVTECITTNAHLQTDKELYWVFGYHKQEIMDYCKQDATLTCELGEFLMNKIQDTFGVIPTSLVSKTGIAKQLIKKEVGDVISDHKRKIPAYPHYLEDKNSAKYAFAAYHGGIFDCKKRGYFSKVTNIDISSAYPYAMVDMPNWSNGYFQKVEYVEDIEDDELYGWFLVEFDYPLIPYTANMVNFWTEMNEYDVKEIHTLNKRKFYPTGKRFQAVTMPELRFLIEFGYITYFHSGYVWRNDPDKHQYPKPFGWIQDVYDEKSRIKARGDKDSYEYSLTKIAMNSAYGLTAQTKGHPAFTNFFYASHITASTRIQIARMLEEIGYDRYILIATDGILLEGHVDIPEKYTKGGLGSWDVDYATDALVLSNGVYQYKIDGRDKPKQGSRGLLSYRGDLIADLTKHKDETDFYPDAKRRPVTFYRSLYWKEYTRDSMNRFVMMGRKLNVNSDTSKEWEQVSCFGDLLENQYVGRRFTMEEIQAQEEDD